MNIPLWVKAYEDRVLGTQMEIWSNKKRIRVDRPFNPYMYFSKPQQHIRRNLEDISIQRISDLKKMVAYKYDFNSVKDIPRYRNEDSFECDVPYLQRIAIDKPDFYMQYPQIDELDILYFDIETDTAGLFPRPERNPVISIGYAHNNGPIQILYINKLEDGDKHILEQFNAILERINPDIIVGYNCDFFDIPYMIDRCRIQKISTKAWTRHKQEAFYIDRDGERRINIQGRVVFDIFNEVLQDQTLYGITSRGMKDVAQWFNVQNTIKKIKGYENYEIVTEEVDNTRAIIGTKRLRTYNESDILITRALSNLYFKNILMFAEMLKVPISMVTQRTASLISTILYARNLREQGIVSDSANHQRYPKIFGRASIDVYKGRVRTVFKHGTGYQGAIVDIFKKGVIRNIYHVDFAGMYPSIMRTFNLSPETAKIKGYEDIGEFSFERFKNKLIIKYPDNKIGKNVVIHIDMTKKGFLPRMLTDYANERGIIKKQLKDPETPTYMKESLVSRSWCLKVIANASYGINGSAYFRYGDIVVSMTTTALGRYFISFVLDYCKEKSIEVDTDGVYIEGNIDLDDLNKKLNNYIEETFKVKNYLELELDGPYPSGFFMKKKNYMLMDNNNHIIFHGVAFKGSSKSRLFKRTLKKMSEVMLHGGNTKDIAKEMFNFKTNDIKDFVMRTKVNKPLSMYKSSNCVQKQVAQQAERDLGIDIMIGDSIEYIKQTGIPRYRIRLKVDVNKIDKEYYRLQVLKILEKLGLTDEVWFCKNPNQTKLGVFS